MSKLLGAVRLVVVFSFIAAALGLVLFGPRSSSDAPADRVVVRYWEKWTDFEGEAMRRLIDVFNETRGRTAGVYVDYSTTTQIEFKILVAIAGGDPPDLAGLWPNSIVTLASKGALHRLTEQANQAGIDRETIIPVYYDQCTYHGELYGLPLTPWSLAMYFNRDLFAEYAAPLRAAGLDPERAPRTLEELLRYSEVLQRRNERDQIEMIGYLPGHTGNFGWYYYTWPIWYGSSLTDPATGLLEIDTPEFQAGYDWVQRYRQMAGPDALGRFEGGLANFASPDNPFMIGKVAMMRQGPWFANMIRSYAPHIDFGVAPHPTVDGEVRSYVGQDVLVIPKDAREPEAAWTFIEWLYTSPPIRVPSRKEGEHFGFDYYEIEVDGEQVRKPMPPLRPIEWICWVHYKNGPLQNPSEEFIATHPNPAIEMHEQLARVETAVTDPALPNWFELQQAIQTAYIDIWHGGQDPQTRLAQLHQRVEHLTELARRAQARHGGTYP